MNIKDINNRKVHIFDMDGTLLNLENVNYSAYARTLKDFFGTELSQEEYQRFFSGTRTRWAFEQYNSHVNKAANAEEQVILFRKLKREILSSNSVGDYVSFIPGAKEYLEKLSKEERIIILATSTIREFTDILLRSQGIQQYFDFILTAEDASKGKPDPEVYEKAINLSGLNTKDILVYEDSKNGIASGLASGCNVVGIHTKGLNDEWVQTADYVIQSFEELM